MANDSVEKILALPEFHELIHRRRRLIIPLVILILGAYYGFILMVAFAPSVLGQKIGDGVASLGIYVGLGILLLSFAISGVYIHVAGGPIRGLLATIRHKTHHH